MKISWPSPKPLLVLFALALASCSTLERKAAVPPDLRRQTSVLGIPNARFFPDQPGPMMEEQRRALIRESRYLGVAPGGELPKAHLLSLSGGGDGGAFGAGVMVGWTAHGDRPTFKLVTGVSTGSLIAPFAFLGSDFDDELDRRLHQHRPGADLHQEVHRHRGARRRRIVRHSAAVCDHLQICQ